MNFKTEYSLLAFGGGQDEALSDSLTGTPHSFKSRSLSAFQSSSPYSQRGAAASLQYGVRQQVPLLPRTVSGPRVQAGGQDPPLSPSPLL